MIALEDKIIWGGLYKVKHRRWDDKSIPNDQVYYQAVPCRRKDGSIWMQDTHQLERCSMKKGQTQTEAAIERIINLQNEKSGDWAIFHSKDQWYHDGNEKLTESKLDDYELICDLHDYRPFETGEDYRDYNEEDILHNIHLFNEHGYSWSYGDIGIKLVRKSAEPVLFNKFIASKQDVWSQFKFPHSYRSSKLQEMIHLYNQLEVQGIKIPPKVQNDYELCNWVNTRLEEMEVEISQYRKEHRYVPNYQFADTQVGSFHIDISRYLENDCYCPHEIYDLTGFSYQLLYESDPAKLIYQDNRYLLIATIFKESGDYDPQAVLFGIEKNKIVSAIRFDITQTNIEIINDHICNRESLQRASCYPEYTFPEDIENLIKNWEVR